MPLDSTAHLMKRLGFALVYALLPAALAQLEVGAGLKVAFGEPRATVEARVGEESFELNEGHPGADRRISLAACQLDFDDNLSAREVEEAVSAIERDIKAAHPDVSRVFIEAQGFAADRRAGEPREDEG